MKRSLGVDIAIHLKIMFWAGLWVPSNSSIAKLLYGFFILVSGVMAAALLLSQLLNLGLGDFNLILFAHSLATITSNIKILIILIRFTYMKKELQNLINNFITLRTNWKSYSETENKILENAGKESQKLTKVILSGYAVLMTIMSVQPLVSQDNYINQTNSTDIFPERLFVVPSWYPWDTTSTTMYAVTYISQIYAFFMVCMQIVLYLTLTSSIFIQIAAEVDIIYEKFIAVLNPNIYKNSEESKYTFSQASNSTVQNNNNEKLRRRYALNEGDVSAETNSSVLNENHLEETHEKLGFMSVPFECANDPISNISLNSYDRSEEEEETYDDYDDEAYRRLIEIVKHHQYIFSFSKEVDTMFRPIYLFQFASITFGLCFSCFLAASPSSDSETKMQFIVFTGLLMAQLLLPCWYGQRVTDQIIHFTYSILLVLRNMDEEKLSAN